MKQSRLLTLLITSAASCAPIATTHARCPGDLNCDHFVDGLDWAIVLGAWDTANEVADINDDGTVDATDLSFILSGWGACHDLNWATVLELLPPKSVVPDVDMRNAIITTGLPWRVRDCHTGIEMLLIPPGSFTMGCSPTLPPDGWCSDNERDPHTVHLTNAFYLGRYEVTQAQWFHVMTVNPSIFQPPLYTEDLTRPVEELTQGLIAVFNGLTGLRLPTEAEWEYAYRAQMGTAVTRTAFHNGTDDEARVGEIAWFSGNNDALNYGTKSVGGKDPNALGLHDMSGNVMEHVNDWTGPYPLGPVWDPIGGSPPGALYQEVRGGSWSLDSDRCRASKRWAYVFSSMVGNYGCRAARNP